MRFMLFVCDWLNSLIFWTLRNRLNGYQTMANTGQEEASR